MHLRTTALLVLVTACSTAPGRDPGDPPVADCQAGMVLMSGECVPLCARDVDCGSTECCLADTCGACPTSVPDRSAPFIQSIDGTGLADGEDGRSLHHVTDRVFVQGDHLADARFVLTGPDGAEALLLACSQTDGHVELSLPEGLAEGAYVLAAMNEAGVCQSTVNFLKGEPGVSIAVASDPIIADPEVFASSISVTGSVLPMSASIMIAGKEYIVSQPGKNLYLVRFDLASHSVVSQAEGTSRGFDVDEQAHRGALGQAISEATEDELVIIASAGDIGIMSAAAYVGGVLESYGGSWPSMQEITADHGFAFIGSKGLGLGGGLQQVAGVERSATASLSTFALDRSVVGFRSMAQAPEAPRAAISCGAGDFLVGIDADGAPQCVAERPERQFGSPCSDAQKVVGINADSSFICQDDRNTTNTYSGANFALSGRDCDPGHVMVGVLADGQPYCADRAGNADLLQGLSPAHFTNASNLTGGTLDNARLADDVGVRRNLNVVNRTTTTELYAQSSSLGETATGNLRLGGIMSVADGSLRLHIAGGPVTAGVVEVWDRVSISGGHPWGTFPDPGPGGLYVHGNVTVGTDLSARNISMGGTQLLMSGKDTIQSGDSWLRLNNTNHFASGVHTQGHLNAGRVSIGPEWSYGTADGATNFSLYVSGHANVSANLGVNGSLTVNSGTTLRGDTNIQAALTVTGSLIRTYSNGVQYSLGGVFKVSSAILADAATRQRLPLFINNTSFDETGKTNGLIKLRTRPTGPASDTDNPWISGYRATKLLCELLTESPAGHMCNEEEIRRSDELGIATGPQSFINQDYGFEVESHPYGASGRTNDCARWTTTDPNSEWHGNWPTLSDGAYTRCNATYPIACCL